MASSGSEDGGRVGVFHGPNASADAAAGQWQDAVRTYSNDLFRAEEGTPASAAPASGTAPAGTSTKMLAQKSALAARRHERLQAGIYQSNSNSMTRSSDPSATTWPQLPDAAAGGDPKAPRPHGSVYGLQGTYDPNEEHLRQVAVNAGTALPAATSAAGGPVGAPRPRPPPAPPPLDLSNLPAFLMQPGPRGGVPRMAYIVRDKGKGTLTPRFMLYLEDPQTFLLAARKRKKQTTSNYLVSREPDDLARDSPHFFGKLRANFVGTEFSIFDRGSKVGKGTPGALTSVAGAGSRKELGAVTYQYNVMGTRGPRKMTAVVPALDAAGQWIYRPVDQSDTMLERLKASKGLHELVVMHNKPPKWSDEFNAYCLNFNGRVTEASVKNFQLLVTDDKPDDVILQFGKIGKNTFTMDYAWPMSALQAFCICLSAFDNKLACE